jgi:hypothetical protein
MNDEMSFVYKAIVLTIEKEMRLPRLLPFEVLFIFLHQESSLYNDIRPYISFQLSFTVVFVVRGKHFNQFLYEGQITL